MALGDYTPTSWANGTSPAISATNLGHIETKIDEIDLAIATGIIVATGSNENGSYIKFNNGTMIQYGSRTQTTATSGSNIYGSTSGTSYYNTASQTLPLAFSSASYHIVAGIISNTAAITVSAFITAAQTFNGIITAGSNSAYSYSFIAIGPWS